MIYHIKLSRSNVLHIFYTYSIHLYYYTIFSVEKCRDGLEFPKKFSTRSYSLQGRDTPLWYTPKIGSGQNLLSRPDPTDSLLIFDEII